MVNLHIFCEEIPNEKKGTLADFAFAVTKKVFSDPEEEGKYQNWLAERKRVDTKSELSSIKPKVTNYTKMRG